jgi:hypothetical protein
MELQYNSSQLDKLSSPETLQEAFTEIANMKATYMQSRMQCFPGSQEDMELYYRILGIDELVKLLDNILAKAELSQKKGRLM